MTFRVILIILLFGPLASLQAQVKKQFQDKDKDNRTTVVKENGADDYKILDQNFGDAKVGAVIRIKTEKEPRERVVVQQEKKEPPPPEKKRYNGPEKRDPTKSYAANNTKRFKPNRKSKRRRSKRHGKGCPSF